MEHRGGEKYGGEHSSLTDLSAEIADMLVRINEVEKISPGYLIMGQGSGRGRRHVKIIDEQGCILLRVRQSGSIQEVRVFTKQRQSVKLALARWLRNSGIDISFQDKK